MLNNVGPLDRIIRVLIGIGLLSLYFVLEGAQRWWAVVGIVPLATALIGWCPLYVPFGLSTRGKRG
jgi:hypothetical protein